MENIENIKPIPVEKKPISEPTGDQTVSFAPKIENVGFKSTDISGLLPDNRDLMHKIKQELLVREYAQQTKDLYQHYIFEFLSFSKKNFKDVSRDDIMGFLAHKKESKNLKPASMALIYSALRFLFVDYLHFDVMKSIKLPKKTKQLPSILSKEEILKLFNSVGKDRDRLILEFLYSTGVRVSECVNFKLNDVNFEQNLARVSAKKDRTISLSPQWVLNYQKHLSNRELEGIQSDHVFCKSTGGKLSVDSIQLLIKQAGQRAGISKKISPHTLRHSLGAHLMQSGTELKKIQALLGHTSSHSTQVYLKVSGKEVGGISNPLDALLPMQNSNSP